jgi:transketolase
MRNEFAKAVLEIATKENRVVFLTGDLGFNALEELRDTLGNRFINAGVAEQNMVSVAAGMAAEGFLPLVYSITPFVILRPYEQIRNDVCFHNLPVILVGNGGGYGYGIMGSSHHALQDIGIMRMLPNMKIIVPTFSTDLEQALGSAFVSKGPVYLRLNSAPKSNSAFAPFRKLHSGTGPVLIGTGPVVLNALKENLENFGGQFSVWALGVFPLPDFPEELLTQIKSTKKIFIIEEHMSEGGLGEAISHRLFQIGCTDVKIVFAHAKGYPSGKYGSQQWHQAESGLVGKHLFLKMQSLLE